MHTINHISEIEEHQTTMLFCSDILNGCRIECEYCGEEQDLITHLQNEDDHVCVKCGKQFVYCAWCEW